jgi:hypothetical protein
MQPSCGRPAITWIVTRHNRLMVGVMQQDMGQHRQYILLASCAMAMFAGCSTNQSAAPPRRILTDSAIVPFSELQSILDAGAFADISDTRLADDSVELPRLANRIEDTESGHFDAVFKFGNEERRVKSLSGQVSVLTDGTECVVVDEDQCGSPVRIVKIDKAGKTLFEFSEYHHAHSRVCFMPKQKLILVWIFDLAEIRAYTWDECSVRFTIILPHTHPPLMVLTKDQQFLYVRHDAENNQSAGPVVRKYNVSDLLRVPTTPRPADVPTSREAG